MVKSINQLKTELADKQSFCPVTKALLNPRRSEILLIRGKHILVSYEGIEALLTKVIHQDEILELIVTKVA